MLSLPREYNDLDVIEDPRPMAQIEKEYLLAQLLGEGTFGKVFRVVRKKDSKVFALKSVLQNPKFKNRERGIFRRLDHMNVPKLYDSFFSIQDEVTADEIQKYFLTLIMELFPTTLYKVLNQNLTNKRHIPLIAIKIYSFQLFKVLAYFHDLGLCHRDLKPSNILIDPDNLRLVVCDYGSAKFIKQNESNIAYMCSRFYRAPELLFGKTDYDGAVDVWSAGCIVAEMVTRDPVFGGQNSIDQIIEIIKIVGSPPKEYLVNSNIFHQNNFPTLKGNRWKSVFRKYPNVDEHLIDFLPKVLAIDRKQRWKPVQLLLHPFFDQLLEKKHMEIVMNVPGLFDFSRNTMTQGKKQLLIQKFTTGLKKSAQSCEQKSTECPSR